MMQLSHSSRGSGYENDNKFSVAIVDDEEDFVKLLVMLLNKRGMTVSFIAHDGSEAVERYRIAVKKSNVNYFYKCQRASKGRSAKSRGIGLFE